MENIKNILVPLDLSDYSAHIVNTCKWLSERLDAHFYFLHIVDERTLFSFKQLEVHLRDNLVDISKKALDAIIHKTEFNMERGTTEVILGEPFIEIISKSTTRPPADLVIVGGVSSQGVHKIGDNAFKIIQMSPTHTLVLKEKKGVPADEDIRFKKILVALDFSEHSLMALDYVLSLKSEFHASVHIFHVAPDEETCNEEKVRKQLQSHLSEQQLKNIDVIEVRASNDTAREILDELDKAEIDLLAIGSHSRRRFLRNLFLGKVAYDVVRKANSSILIFKAHA
ncbi:MAG: universal stress protein [Deltaproteobacteria bacterium]|nr:universal stress protein [Deltaproteobacteria bacterium]